VRSMARVRPHPSSSAKADDPVFRGVGYGTQLRAVLDSRFRGNDASKDHP
jgi:hypothetical protein